MTKRIFDTTVGRNALGVFRAVSLYLCLGQSKGHNTRLVAEGVGETARDDGVAGVVGAPIGEVGHTSTETALVHTCCVKVGVEGFLRVERCILNGKEPKQVVVDSPIVATPLATTVLRVGAEVGEVDIGCRQAEEGAVSSVPIGSVVTTTITGGGVHHRGENIVVAVKGGLVSTHEVTGNANRTVKRVQGNFGVHVALCGIEGGLAVVLGHFNHDLSGRTVQHGSVAIFLLGGIVFSEVVEHYATVVDNAPAHQRLNREVLMEGGRTDTGEVGRGVAVVMAHTVHLVIAVVGDNHLLPLRVPREDADLTIADGEVAERRIAASLGSEESHPFVTCGEGIRRGHHATKEVALGERGLDGGENLVETLTRDCLRGVLVHLCINQSFKVFVIHCTMSLMVIHRHY